MIFYCVSNANYGFFVLSYWCDVKDVANLCFIFYQILLKFRFNAYLRFFDTKLRSKRIVL